MGYEAEYETTDKTIIEVPLIGTKLIELPDGRVVDFNDPINDSKYGVLKYIKIVQIPDPLPQPYSPIRAEAIKTLLAGLARYPGDDHQGLLKRNPRLKTAIDRDFLGVSIEAIQGWTDIVQSEAEERKQERIRATPPPVFSQFQLTRDLYHGRGDFGDLKVDGPGPKQHGTPAASFEDCEWWCYCSKCERQGLQMRFVPARILLEIECGFRPKYECEGPCTR
jgi:hypothetical protein